MARRAGGFRRLRNRDIVRSERDHLEASHPKPVNSVALDAERAPVPIARPEIHKTVAGILDPLSRGRLLDVPAGEGALSARLAEMGFEIHACDLYPEIFRVKNIEVKRGDLSGTLPYGDAEFQYITCLEGLEHIENPHQAIREFARLLSPGGHLIISVPNILNIEERVKWLLSGAKRKRSSCTSIPSRTPNSAISSKSTVLRCWAPTVTSLSQNCGCTGLWQRQFACSAG
jgi:2-polyprenyl-3-methyl-5-hydroxy-6-metoxy-1,4-benzoquinol methylase